MNKDENNIKLENVVTIKPSRKHLKDMKPAIIVLSIALVLFLACTSLFAWNIIRMRNFESDYIKTYGLVVDIKSHTSGSSGHRSTSYFYVISYTFEGEEYSFTDNVGRRSFNLSDIGKYTKIYINPEHPNQAVTVASSGSISIGYSCCFCFFCFAYGIGMNILLGKIGTSFKKRLMFIWVIEILLGLALFLLPWLGFPDSSFGEIFARIDGEIGLIVICVLVLIVTIVDGVITFKIRSYESRKKG